jgi:DNA polymerase-3 subunit beta
MKATVQQQQLSHGVSVVARAVSARSTLPVLSNILVKTDEGRLRLSATNLELGISCWIGARIQEDGAVTVPARTFADLISNLPNDEVVLSLDERTQTLNVRCGSLNSDIKCISAEEFPPMPSTDLESSLPLNISNFKEMIQEVVFAASPHWQACT